MKKAGHTQSVTAAITGVHKASVSRELRRNRGQRAHHARISEGLGARFYFARPHASWERGVNEHTTGLVRQYFPKRADFATITQAEVEQVVERLHERPRKTLGYRTPNEVFYQRRPVALHS